VKIGDDELQALDRARRHLRDHALRLYLAEKTVKNYVSNLLTKLGMHRRTEAAVYATRPADRRRQQQG
jgi:two-component system response regulator DevR